MSGSATPWTRYNRLGSPHRRSTTHSRHHRGQRAASLDSGQYEMPKLMCRRVGCDGHLPTLAAVVSATRDRRAVLNSMVDNLQSVWMVKRRGMFLIVRW